MEKKTVWLIYTGIYSDREVIYVASSKEQAERFQQYYSSVALEMEEVELDRLIPSVNIYRVSGNIEDNIMPEKLDAMILTKDMIDYNPELYQKNNIQFHNLKNKINVNIIVSGKDVLHAAKAARELLSIVLSSPEQYPMIFNLDGKKVQNGVYNVLTKELITFTSF